MGGAVFRSVACAGANERSECCGPVAGGGDGPPASARRYCAEKGVRPELGLSFEVSLSRCFALPASAVPLGTPTGEMNMESRPIALMASISDFLTGFPSGKGDRF